ncbi:MAG: putative membrane protein YfcA [Candidatus Azotimanducaceae bacterium]
MRYQHAELKTWHTKCIAVPVQRKISPGEIANMELTLLDLLTLLVVMLGTGCIAGITAGLFGVGGGFIVVPALLTVFPFFDHFEEKHIYVAIGTSLATIIVSSARAVQAHSRTGSVDFLLLKDWAPWLVLGVVIGTALASVVNANSLLLVFATGVFIYSFYFLLPKKFNIEGTSTEVPSGAGRAAIASGLGGFSALLGIGGGTPFVVTMTMCGRSFHQAIATASGVGFIIAVPGAIGFLLIGLSDTNLPWGSIGYLNIPALIAISIMSVFTAPVGARLAHKLNDQMLKRAFGTYLFVISTSMFYKTLI